MAKVLVLQDQNAGEPLLMQIPDCLAFDCKYADFPLGLMFDDIVQTHYGHSEIYFQILLAHFEVWW